MPSLCWSAIKQIETPNEKSLTIRVRNLEGKITSSSLSRHQRRQTRTWRRHSSCLQRCSTRSISRGSSKRKTTCWRRHGAINSGDNRLTIRKPEAVGVSADQGIFNICMSIHFINGNNTIIRGQAITQKSSYIWGSLLLELAETCKASSHQ